MAILAVIATATCSRKASTPPAAAGNQLDRVAGPIDTTDRVEVPESVHKLTQYGTDLGEVAPDFALNGIILAFRQSPAQQADLTKLLADQQNPSSPRFHQWLTPAEFGTRFGLTDHDLDAVTRWLTAEGLTVQRVSNSRTRVFIGAQARDVERVFHTQLHRFVVHGEEHFANARPVEVPRALGDMVLYVAGLNDFIPKAHPRAFEGALPDYTTGSGGHALAPADFATIYDIQNLYNYSTTLDGTGASLAVVGQTTVTASDLTNFRTVAGLPTLKLNNWLVPNSGSSTYSGATGDIQESTLDLEWSGAVARNATINFVYTGGGSGYSVWNSIEAVADSPSAYGSPKVVSISYGYCEPLQGSGFSNYLETFFQQGNTEGLTLVVSTGDSGAAGCDVQEEGSYADGGLAVQMPSTYPEATAAGGSELVDVDAGTYWSPTNGTDSLSALSYIPETGWNDSALGGGLASSCGGASIFYSKPSWQTGTGVPADGMRDVPDIALSASWDHDAYLLCITTGGTQYCAPGDGWDSTGSRIWLEGGTSAAAPTFAGMITVLNQAFGSTGFGNINSTLYSLVSSEPSVFHDITTGNNIVPCNPGSASCGCPTGTPGCTAGQDQFGYTAGTGYDQVTGLGSVDAYNMWKYWPTTTTTSLTANSTTAVVGENVTLSSSVTTNRIGLAITGNIAFDDSATQLTDPAITSATNGSGVVSGSASFSTSGLGTGTHALSAIYSGDSTYKTSTGSLALTITSGITVSPSGSQVAEGGIIDFTASGGVAPYSSWSVTTTSGSSIVSGTGVYTAGTTPGTDTIHVLDSQNYSGSTTVTIVTPIAIAPTASAGEVGVGVALSASNGQPSTYQWAITTNNSHGSLGSNCTTGSASCTYTPGTTSGVTDTVAVSDALSESASATITVAATLGLSPSSASMGAGSTYSGYSTSGGVGPYTWSVSPSGQGVTISSSGVVTATSGATTGSYTILLADSLNVHATAGLTVNAALAVSPASSSADIGGGVTLHASGGSGAGYTWSTQTNSSSGSLGSNCTVGSTSCTWTTGSTSGGTDVIKLVDGNGVSVTASIVVDPKPVVTPASTSTDTGIAVALTASSGSGGGYAWSIMTSGSGGTLGSNCTAGGPACTWTVGSTASSTDKIEVTDGNGGTATATITVNPLLAVAPATKTTDANTAVALTGSGGSSTGYAWTIGTSGSGGSLGSNCTAGSTSCTWTTGGTAGTDTIKLADSTGKTVTATITVDAALVVSPATKTTDTHQAIALSVSGGSGGSYTWTISTNSSAGTLGANCTTGSTACTWTTGGTSGGTDVIKVTDGNGVSATSSITIDPTLAVSPATKTTDATASVNLTASGGSGSGYSWVVTTNHSGGSLGSNCTTGSTTCTWSCGSTSGGNDVVTLTDSNNVSVTSTITVDAALAVSPASTGTDVSHSVTLTASGGSGTGYVWAIGTNTSVGSLGSNCTSGSTTCTWTTGTTPGGTDVIDLTDSNSVTVTASIAVGSQLVVTPATTAIDTVQSVTLTASGGSGTGYKWTINTNGSSGSLGSNCTTGSTTCTWTTGSTGGTTDKVQLADSNNITTLATITVNALLAVSPATKTTDENTPVTLTASGGSGAGYTWAIGMNGSGGSLGSTCTMGSTTCTWTAGGATGTDTIRLTDSLSKMVTATLTVDTSVVLTPSSKVTDAKAATTLTASGGSGTGFTWSIGTNSSGGSLGSNCTSGSTTCTWTAGSTSGGSDIIKVTDSNGGSATSTLTIDAALVVTPAAKTTDAGASVTLTASAGSGTGYAWAIGTNHSGGSLGSNCTAGSTTCTWTTGATSGGNDVIDLTDSNGATVTSTITVDAALVVSPASTGTDVRSSVTLTASGGSGTGYTWTIGMNTSGGSLGSNCTSGSTTCTWTAGSTAGGADVVDLTDSNGVTVASTIAVGTQLVLTPATDTLDTGQSVTLTVSGGSLSLYHWTISTNGSSGSLGSNCTLGSTTCTWTVGSTGGTSDVIKVTDGYGVSTTSTITVDPVLTVTPATKTTDEGSPVTLTASGGSASGYTWAIGTSGSGGMLGGTCTTGSTTCTWTAGSSTGTDTITLTDSLGKSVTATITVDTELFVTPSSKVTDAKAATLLTVSGGSGSSYTWAIGTNSSGGSLSGCATGSTTCTWTAGTTSGGTDVIKVTDGNGVTVASSLTIDPALVVSPAAKTTDAGASVALTASGGSSSGYTWTIGTNHSGGSLGSSCTTGSATCTWNVGPTSGGSDVIDLTDSNGVTVTATLTVDAALVVSPASTTTDATVAVSLTASGGAGSGYTWAIGTNSSSGSLGSNCTAGGSACTWTTGSTSGGTDIVKLTDANGVTVLASITVDPLLVVTPATTAVDTAEAVSLTASGGSGAGYKWTISTNGSSGSLGSNCTAGSTTCTWTTGSTAGTTDKIELTDSNNVSVLATITINPLLAVSPATKTTDANNAVTLTASGGSGASYTWAVSSSGSGGSLGSNCTVGSATCTWTTGGSAGTDVIKLSDSTGKSVTSTITVDAALVVVPATKTTDAKASVLLTVSGGSGGSYTWAIGTNSSGGGLGSNCTVGSTSCTWTVGTTSGGTDIIKVTDGNSITVTSTLTIDAALVVSPASSTTEPGYTVTLTASGGAGSGYAWTVGTNGSGGSLGSNCSTPGSTSCTWTAGSTTTSTDTIQLTDGNGVTVVATITVDPVLVIAPVHPTVTPIQTLTFTATGGSGTGYTYAFATGGNLSGGTMSAAGAYQAGTTSGVTDTVQVKDSLGFITTTTITVEGAITISPLAPSADPGLQITFLATGGSGAGYTWSYPTGGNKSGGSLTSGGLYTAGSTTGVTDTVLVTDSKGGTASTTITVRTAVVISPATPITTSGGMISFSASGGSGTGYTFSFATGGNLSGGTISSAGAYQAGSSSGVVDKIQAKDSVGLIGTTTITVDPDLVITPTAPTTVITGTITFTATGGSGTGYTWSYPTGGNKSGGTLSAAGAYVAGSTSGVTDTVQVKDSVGNVLTTTIIVDPKIVITPSNPIVLSGGQQQFSATGGSGGGYTWAYATGGDNSNGQITPAGLYTGGTTSGVTDTVKVTDSAGNTTTTTIIVHPAIIITPSNPTELVTQHVQFSATGGSGSGYAWAYATGGNRSGGTLSAAGAYVAGSTSGVTDTVQVTDSSSSTATTNVIVDPTLTISPTSKTVAVGDTVVFTSTGGGGGNTWSISTNHSGGSLNGGPCTGLSSCTYKAGTTSGVTDTITVMDAYGNSVSAVITVNPAPALSPTSATVAVGNTVAFTATGGVGALTWSISPNNSNATFTGSSCTGATSCTYKAGTSGGVTDSVVITDTLGNTATVVVTVNPALGISPSSATVAVTDQLLLTATGGVGPFNWSIVANASGAKFTAGTCTDVSSCTYQAGSTSGTDTVMIEDSLSNTATIVITVNPGLGLSPPATTVAAGDTIQFFASGGVNPLTWSLTPNGSGGTFEGGASSCYGTDSCVYVAGSTGNTTDTVLITDARGNTFSTVVTVNPALAITPASKTVAVSDTLQLTATGGVGSLTWSISTNHSGASFQGGCPVGSTTCTYLAGTTSNEADTITVTDVLHNTAAAVITVDPSLTLSPTAMTVTTGDTVPFTASGGAGSLTWTVSTNHSGAAGLSACNGKTTCSYVAGATGNTTDVVTVTDALNNTASATVTVNAKLTISPAVDSTEVSSSVPLVASGGVAPLSWAVSTNESGAYFQQSSNCADLTSCTYVAGPTGSTTDIVTVTDALGHTATATITVASGITLTPASVTLVTGDSEVITVVGGSSPFTWSVIASSGGRFSGTCGTTCTYVVGGTSGVTDTISVVDSLGHGATAKIVVDPALTMSPTADTVATGDEVTLTSTGGVAPISWAIPTNNSSAYFLTSCGSASSCTYVAGPTGNMVDTVTVTDSLGHTATATITVNPALTISPAAFTLAVGNTTSFTASGGVGSYTWGITTNHSNSSLQSGLCAGDASCTYNAGLTGGTTDVLTVEDAKGHAATATITVNAALAISPTSKTVDTGDTITFTAAGGAGISSWAITHNSSGSSFTPTCGTATTCTWKAGTMSGGSDTITVTDIRGNTSSAAITVNAALAINPTSLTVSSGDITLYTATGGVSPLSWTVTPNNSGATYSCGSSTTCSVTAGPTSGTVDTVTVQDSAGHSASATVTVNAKLTINPTSATVAVSNTLLFTASGGVGTLSWTISPNASGATLLSCGSNTTCDYKAGSTGGTDTVNVSDQAGHTASATVIVGGTLSLSPASTTVATGDVVPLTASGGAGALTWTLSTDLSGGRLSAGCNGTYSCTYTAGSTSGRTDVVTVTDTLNNTATAMITVNPALTISPVSITLAAGDTTLFTAAGGVGALSWTVTPDDSGAASLASCAGATTCHYTAGATGGTTDTVVVSDALHHTASAVVTVHAALTVAPVFTTVAVSDAVTMTASGGVGTLNWALTQNSSSGYFEGTCNGSSSCTWVTGSVGGGTDVITVSDSLGNTASTHLTVNGALAISPSAKTVTVGDSITFTATGGSSFPTWSFLPAGSGASFLGSCNGKQTCTYLVGTQSGTVETVTITDSVGNQATATVTVDAALAVSPTSATVSTGNAVALTSTGGVGAITWSISPNNSMATLTCSSATSCSYVAGSIANQTDTVVVTDSLGNEVSATIAVHAQPVLSPVSETIVVGDTVQLTATGGVGAFTWSLSAPSGGTFTPSCPVGSTTCTYQAGTTSGTTDTVTVTDTLGNHATASIVVNPALTLTPASSTVTVNDTIAFTAAGGTGSLAWTISPNNSGGAFTGSPCAGSQTCQYKAGTSPNTLDTITVTDSAGDTASALVTVDSALAISPVAKIVAVGNKITFNASGGVGTLSWSISPDNSGASLPSGGCSGSSCVYTAGMTANKVDTVTVTDSLHNTASATVTVNAALALTPATSTVVTGNTVTLTASGGVSTLTWTISPNRSNASLGTCNGRTTCTYTAGNTSGVTDTINVTDALGNVAHATVTVDAALVLTPTTDTVYQSGSVAFSTTGGVPPLSWTIPMDNSNASLAPACNESATCTYTAGLVGDATDVVTVTDARGNTQSATITVVTKLAVSPTAVTIAPNQSVVLNTNGTGAAPFSWSLDVNATGYLSDNAGSSVTYTAGSVPDTQDTVTVIDLLGETATVTITIGNGVSISPLAPTIVAGSTETFSAFGGNMANGYTWSVISATPLGYFSGDVYTSTTPGTDTIQASDDLGNTATTTITIVPPLAVTPPSPISLAPRQKVTLETEGTGLGPYQWSLEASPSGSLSASTGASVTYTAGASPNKSDVLTITDALNESVTVTISVGAALTISPLGTTILSGSTQTFTATGGDSVDGYTWTDLSANPVGHFNGNVYTAGSTGGTDTVQVSDADGNTAQTTITVDTRLAITPASPVQLAPRQQVTFNSQGSGAPPLTWSLQNNPSGSLSATTGSSVTYTAAATPEVQDTITVRDTFNEVVTIVVNVGPSVSITPLAPLIFTKGTESFTATGGNAGGGYAWSITSANPVGSISSTGVYTAGTAAGTDTILVSDSLGNSASTTITVVVPLVVTPGSPVSVAPRQQVTFQTSSTGLAPWTWKLRSPPYGTLSSSSGATVTYTAGTFANQQDVLTVSDAAGESVPITINIGPGITLSPQTPTILVNGMQAFTATGGYVSGGYTWSITNASPVGTLSSGGVYTAGSSPGTDTIQVVDTLGNVATTTIVVRPTLSVTPPSPVTVAPRQAVTFSTGATGIAPIHWVFGGSPQGSLSATTGTTVTYTAGATPNTSDSLVITDAVGERITVAISIGPGITITPASPVIPAGGTEQFSATGGGGSGYAWSITNTSPVGSLSGSVYTAGSTPGTDTIQAQDLLGNVATTSITVVSKLAVTPASPVQVAPNANVVFSTGSTGRGPYQWSLGSSPSGSLSSSSGTSVTYTAGATANTGDVITVTDSLSQSVSITVNIGTPIVVTPAASTIVVTKTQTFSATGGDSAGGYRWSITNANPVGFLTGNVYSAGFGTGTDTIQAKDSYGSVGTTTITVVQRLAVTPASPIALAPRASITLQTNGTGVSPFTWSLESSPSGSLSATSGASVTYTAGAVPDSQDTITVTDSAHETVSIVVNVGVALSINPTTPTIAAGGSETFTGSGGDSVHGYTWSITNANPVGAISTTGAYTAGTGAGTDTVQVADDVGNVATTTITVVPDLALTPTSPVSVAPRQSISLSTNGTGEAPYAWILGGNPNGSLSAASGASVTYTAGSTPNTSDTVTVGDALTETAAVTINIGAGITIQTPPATIITGGTQTYTATGGYSQGGYTWSVVSATPLGSFTGAVYTAGATPGTDTIRVADNLGNTATTTITIVAPLSVSPMSPVTLAPLEAVTFAEAGGLGPFHWKLVSDTSGGGLVGTTFTAGATGNTQATISVSDALSEMVIISVTIGPGVSIMPAAPAVLTGAQVTFTAQGGVGQPYHWSIPAAGNGSGGSIGAATGDYTAGPKGGTVDTISVVDGLGNVATTQVTVESQLAITPSDTTTLSGTMIQFDVTGGSGVGYSWSFMSDSTVTGSTITPGGSYQAGPNPGTDTLLVVDSQDNSATTTVTIVPSLQVMPASPVTVPPRGSVTFTSTGGEAPVQWTLAEGSEATLSSNVYTAGPTPDTQDQVAATDALQEKVTITINVGDGVTITPATAMAIVGTTLPAFVAAGGTGGPYSWSIVTNANHSGGHIDPQSGVYTAGTIANVTDIIEALDSLGNSGTASIMVVPMPAVDAGMPVDAGIDAGPSNDAGVDAGLQPGGDAGTDAGETEEGDAGADAGTDAGVVESSDGGETSDAAVSDGGPQTDAGVGDAGVAQDAGDGGELSDAGESVLDAGQPPPFDAGNPEPAGDAGTGMHPKSGCACSPGDPASDSLAQLALFSLAFLLRRRRRAPAGQR